MMSGDKNWGKVDKVLEIPRKLYIYIKAHIKHLKLQPER